MSYIYLQEQGEESLAENFQDIPAYVLSKLNLTQDRCCSKGNETESCQNSQSGMISEHSMENHGEERSISFAEDFLARTFPQLEKELESRANALGYGEKWPGWLAKYDQDLSLWKTPQCSLLEDYIEFSETWPKWGMMRDGVCWELTTSVRRIEERESGFSRMIPTPTCSDVFTSNLKSTQQKPDTMHSVSLAQLCEKMPEKMWPTPTACMCKGSSENALTRKDGTSRINDRLDHKIFSIMLEQKQSFPTPTVSDRFNANPGHDNERGYLRMEVHPQSAKSMTASELNQTNGQLNPDWVEWLMGWPIGWTKTEPIELDWRNWVVDPADTGEVPRVSQSINNRVHRLKAIGNGQVPLVAMAAFKILSECLL